MTSEQKIWRLSFAVSALVHLGVFGFAATIWETGSIQTADGMIMVQALPLENELSATPPSSNTQATIKPNYGRKRRSERENPPSNVEPARPEPASDIAREQAFTSIEDPFSISLDGPGLSERDSKAAMPDQGSPLVGRGDTTSSSPGETASSWEGGQAESAQPSYGINPLPEYPLLARQTRHEGVVLLRVRVLADGTVGELKIERSSGHQLLDEAALKAVKRWTFIPAKRNGIPTPVWVTIPIQFSLSSR